MTRSFDLLGAEVTLKDVIQYAVLCVSALIFIMNMNYRIDNLTASVDRLYTAFEKKDLVDSRQDEKIDELEKKILIFGQIIKISPFP